LAAGELTLRILRPRAVGSVVQPCIYEPDPDLGGFRYRPGADGRIHRGFEIDHHVRINSAGLHDRPPAPREPGELWIAALGDSFTAGIYLPIAQGWPRQLEDALRRRRPNVRVINLGLDGTGTAVQLDRLEQRVAALAPDIVLLAFYANDPLDDRQGRFARTCHRSYVLMFRDDAEAASMRGRVDEHLDAPLAGVRDALYRSSRLWRLGLYAVRGPRHLARMNFLTPPPSRSAAADAPTLDASLERFAGMARRYGFRPLLVPVPPRENARGSVAALQRGVRELPVPVLDVTDRLATLAGAEQRMHRDLYYRYDNHLNAAGQRLFARAIADGLPRGAVQP
jgi:lysophospholipase L1-like esterase